MKRIIALVILMGLISMGCQKGKKKDAATEQTTKTHLQLNQEEKWEANKETTDGVLKMEAILSYRPMKTLEDYHKVGALLLEVKNYIIQKCTMEGAAHDNLHKWLYPLIEDIEKLTEAQSIEQADQTVEAIKDQLKLYHQYFK